MPKNTDTKAVLSILIAAKMSGQRVAIWTNKVGDCNSAYAVLLLQ
jgi:hypothetical protein